jgi:uncharacterized protein (UPF0332 family)
MSPDDFIKTAGELIEDLEERHHRAAVHAAYYSVYHFVASHFGLDPAKYEADHKSVREKLKNENNRSKVPPSVWRAKQHIMYIWNKRRHADYDLSTPFTADDADQVVETCKGILRG